MSLMRAVERLWRWLRQCRGTYCDRCLSQELELSVRQVNRATRTRSTQSNFVRDYGVCSLCDAERKVIQAV